jgi:hypothetical protein
MLLFVLQYIHCIKVLKRKVRYSDYGLIGKNFENDNGTPFKFVSVHRNLRDIEVDLIC